MKKIFRFLFNIPQPKISREKAFKLAEKYFREEGIKIGQLLVIEEMRAWFIWSNANVKTSPWIRLDNQKGNILESGKPIR
jgi:hypothetical protein